MRGFCATFRIVTAEPNLQTQAAANYKTCQEKLMNEQSTMNANIEIALTSDEALVLFEFLSRFSESETLTVVDQAEERALWNLHALLEKTLLPPFQDDYRDQLQQARDQLRDNVA